MKKKSTHKRAKTSSAAPAKGAKKGGAAARRPARLLVRRVTPTGVTAIAASASSITGGPRAKLGPLLAAALSGLTTGGGAPAGMSMMLALASTGSEDSPALPVAFSLQPEVPKPGESWRVYKPRVADRLGAMASQLAQELGIRSLFLYAANALQCRATPAQVAEALKLPGLRVIELDPNVRVLAMNDVATDIELPVLRLRHPELTGRGVRVAVLDSGIDTKHPYLKVATSVTTCNESVDVPGLHGTHVAGSVASRDSVISGVAPEVELLNIKVLDAQGRGQSTFISAGVDAALDEGAEVITMSLGFNHLPTWSQGGHGWSCPDGRCPLCTAVNNAVMLENVSVVVAAGNEHERAEFLRASGRLDVFDTELGCPGQAANVVTVGALTKQTFRTAPFSSRGPAAYGQSKPEIAAPGVNITSTAIAPRDAQGNPDPAKQTRQDLTTRLSGTSMATPIVAGALALLVQRRKTAGLPRDAATIRHELLTQCFRPLGRPAKEVGIGRLTVGGL